MKKFSKKACACIGKLLPNHSHMATCVALGGGRLLGFPAGVFRGCKKNKICYNSDVGHYKNNGDYMNRFAFTLAEVLVTLGIIGVVAAMTMPTLIGNTKPKELEAQFKKAHSMLSQAVVTVADEKGVGLRKTFATYNGKSYANASEIANAVYAQMKVAGTCSYTGKVKNYNKSSENPYVDLGVVRPSKLLANGMCMEVNVNGGMINLTIDINGPKKRPNALGQDIFYFYIDDNDTLQPKSMSKLYTDEEVEKLKESDSSGVENWSSQAGNPCSAKSNQRGNGLGCAYYALINQSPDDGTKTFWENLPK